MIIKFIGMESQSGYYRLGVMQNNLTDNLVFELSAMQGDIDLSAYRPFLKLTNPDRSYADKDGNIEITPTDDGKLRLRYKLSRTIMQYHSVDMQLQFEDYSIADIAVIQSTIFNVAFNATLPADEIVANKEPTIIQDHELRIQTLENTPPVVFEYESHYAFPNIGNAATIYLDKSENITYRFDTTKNKYYIVGSDYLDIKIINANGGNLNG